MVGNCLIKHKSGAKPESTPGAAHKNGSLPTAVPAAVSDPWTFPRANEVSTGHFVAPVCPLVPPFQVLDPSKKRQTQKRLAFLAGAQGLEP